MGLDRLREEAEKRWVILSTIASAEQAACYGLDPIRAPAISGPGESGSEWIIIRAQIQSQRDWEQVEAHEIAHSLLFGTRVSLFPGDPRLDELVAAAENAIDHQHIPAILQEYGVEPTYNQKVMRAVLEGLVSNRRQSTDRVDDHIVGVRLYDAVSAVPELAGSTQSLFDSSPCVLESYLAASTFLPLMRTGATVPDQRRALFSFMEALGYQQELDYGLVDPEP